MGSQMTDASGRLGRKWGVFVRIVNMSDGSPPARATMPHAFPLIAQYLIAAKSDPCCRFGHRPQPTKRNAPIT